MKKLSGFSPVFRYTLKSQMKSKKYIVFTALIGILFLLGVTIAFYFLAAPDKKSSDQELTFSKVYVDLGEVGEVDLNPFVEPLGYERLKNCTFETVKDIKALAKEHEKDNEFIGLTLQKDKDSKNVYNILIVKADDNEFDGDDIDELGEFAREAINQYVLASSGITEEQMMQALLTVDYEVVGSEKGDMDRMIAMLIVTMVTLMAVYFLALIYGAQISSEVSIEKTSKLVEQLLISVTPYGIVTGKIIAFIVAAIIQFFIWVACLVGGLFVGDALLKLTNSSYVSQFSVITKMMTKWFGSVASSPIAWVLAIISLLLSIVIYLVFAGVAGAMVTRPEETSSMQAVFILPMIVAFYIALMGLMSTIDGPGNAHIDVAYSLIPFVSSFIAPGAILTGELSIGMSLLSIGITFAVIVLLLLLAAKVYKALLFFNGNKMNPVKAIKLLFRKS